MKLSYQWMLILVIILSSGCVKEDSKTTTAESSVVEGTRSVVNATGDALRNVVKGVNDAVYGK